MRLQFGACLLALTAGCASLDVVKPENIHSRWALNATPLDRTAAQLDNDVAEHLIWAKVYREGVVNVSGKRTIENTLVPCNEMLMDLDAARGDCELLARVHPDARVRAAATKGRQTVANAYAQLRSNGELQAAIRSLDLSRADTETGAFAASLLGEGGKGDAANEQSLDSVRGKLAGVQADSLESLLEQAAGRLGLRIERVHGLNLWRQEVTAWDVFDKRGKLGRVYLDPGAPGGVTDILIRRGVNGRRLPQAALVGHLDAKDADTINVQDQLSRLLCEIVYGHPRWLRVE